MEKILVGLNSERTSLWPVIYVLNLAKRMDVKISILLVIVPSVNSEEQHEKKNEEIPIRSKLEKLIEEGRADGIPIDYYIAHGYYNKEMIKFIRERKISLLIIESPLSGESKTSEKVTELLGEIKFRTNCRIEVVHFKTIK